MMDIYLNSNSILHMHLNTKSGFESDLNWPLGQSSLATLHWLQRAFRVPHTFAKPMRADGLKGQYCVQRTFRVPHKFAKPMQADSLKEQYCIPRAFRLQFNHKKSFIV